MSYDKETGHIHTLCLRSFEIYLNRVTYPPCFASVDVFFKKSDIFGIRYVAVNSGSFCHSIAKELLISEKKKLFQPLRLDIQQKRISNDILISTSKVRNQVLHCFSFNKFNKF